MTSVQILRGTSVTLTETFQVNGAPLDLDSGVPTVSATYPSGTALTPAPTATHVGAAGSGTYQIVLSAEAEPTWLDLTWVGTIGGKVQTLRGRVEWVGTLLFNLAELRAVKVGDRTPFSSATDWPDAKLAATRMAVLDEFTRILGFSPVPRLARETHSGDGSAVLFTDRRLINAGGLRSVTVDGVTQTLGDFTLEDTGRLTWETGWFPTTRRGNIAVEFVHGWTFVAGDGSNLAMVRAAAVLLPSFSSSTSTVVTPDGTAYSYDPAGQVTAAGRVREFGVPAIDSWVNRWAARVPGFA